MRSRRDIWLAIGCGVAALSLYLRTLAPGVLFGDPAEFQTAAWVAGLAHPTGYPLFLLAGWLWTRLLSLGEPAWRLNLLSASLGATTIGITYLAALRLIATAVPVCSAVARRLAAVVAALLLAVVPGFWSQAIIAEVYTLHALLTALALWVALDAPSPRKGTRLAWLVGLGLAHHRTAILWLPGLAAWAWLSSAPRGWRWLPTKRLLALSAGLILPQLLYLYIPLRAAATPYLQVPLGAGESLALYDHSARGFVQFVLGRAFAGELLSPLQALAQAPAAFALIVRNLSGLGLALAAIGLAQLAHARARGSLALTTLIALSQLAFNLFYGIGDVYVLYAPIYLIAALWMGVGLAALSSGAARWLPRTPRLGALAPPALGMLLPIWMVLANLPAIDRSHDRRAIQFWEQILAEPLPERAILVSNDRDEMTPLFYLQHVDGRRPDLTGLFPLIVDRAGWQNVGQVTASALATGRPVFLVKPMPGLDARFDVQPRGAVVEVTGEVTTTPGAPWGDVGGAIVLEDVEIQPPTVTLSAGQMVTVTLYWRPLQPLSANYTSFVHLLDGRDEKIAQHDAPPGGVYYPTSLWQPGELLRDRHPLVLPEVVPSGPYSLRIGLYAGPDLTPLGAPLLLAWEQVSRP